MSDNDADARKEAFRTIVRRVMVVLIPALGAGALVIALGVPVWVTAIGVIIFIGIMIFEA